MLCMQRYSNNCIYEICSYFFIFIAKNATAYEFHYLSKNKQTIKQTKKLTFDIETWSIDRVFSKKHFYGKSIQKICTKNLSHTP